MFADYHVHTEFSDDSIYPMEDMIRDAVHMNMEEICITDHVDYGVNDDWDSRAEILYRNGRTSCKCGLSRIYGQDPVSKEAVWG